MHSSSMPFVQFDDIITFNLITVKKIYIFVVCSYQNVQRIRYFYILVYISYKNVCFLDKNVALCYHIFIIYFNVTKGVKVNVVFKLYN